MKVDAAAVVRHLKRVYMPGAGIRDAVLRDRWETAAEGKDVVVVAPPLAGAAPLPEPFGIELKPVIDAMDHLGPAVEVTAEHSHLALHRVGDPGNAVRLLRIDIDDDPGHVSSWIDPGTARDVFDRLPAASAQPVATATLREVEDARRMLGAERVELRVGPHGGAWTVVGSAERTHTGQRATIGTDLTADESYTLTFDAGPVRGLLPVLFRWANNPRIHLHGPKRPVVFVDDDGWRWMLAPREARHTV
ncbi:MAG: hypothetical protein R6U63_13840 [Longimicrobiales bacterium]